MSGQIADGKINEVRERVDIVELVSQYVSLKRSGANHMGLCPFHAEKSPSFSVHAGRQFFHCFGCGVGGDVFSFLMKIEGLAFPDAIRRLAERVGVELEERQLSPEEERRQQQRERLFRVNEIAADYFHQLLMEQPQGEPGRQYLKQRGYGRKAANEFQLGYAADSWEGLTRHLQQQNVAAEDARTLGLIRPGKQERGDYDLFRGRLLFPISDLSGRVVAFGGRVLDDSKPKYINSPESPIYHKGQVLFGLYQARQAMRQAGEVILVEGYFDQLALCRAGFPQVVATCGTALTSDHARLLKRYVQKVLLLFDQDAAGKQATFKAMAALQDEGLPAAVIELPSGEDPDSFVQKQGAEAFGQCLAQARPAMDLFMEESLAAAGSDVAERVRAAETILERLSGLPSELEQDLYLKALAERSGIDLQLLKQKLAEVARRTSRPREAPAPPAVEYPAPAEYPPVGDSYSEPPLPPAVESPPDQPQWLRGEEMVLCLLLREPEARQLLMDEGAAEYFRSPAALALAERLLALLGDTPADQLAPLIAKLDPEELPPVKALLQIDPALLSGGVREILAGCRQSLARNSRKQRREELLKQIRAAEQAGDVARAKELMDEFTKQK